MKQVFWKNRNKVLIPQILQGGVRQKRPWFYKKILWRNGFIQPCALKRKSVGGSFLNSTDMPWIWTEGAGCGL